MKAYTISGIIGLENTPAISAIDQTIAATEKAKSRIEAATPTLNVDTRSATESIRAVSQDVTALATHVSSTFAQVQSRIQATREAAKRSEFFGEGGPTASYRPPTAPVTSGPLNIARGAAMTSAGALGPIHAAAEKTVQGVEWNFGRLKVSLPKIMAEAAQATAAAAGASAGQVAHAVVEPVEKQATGFFDRLAARAKALRFDDRKMGESALASFFGRGVEGIADFGLSAAGLGGAATVIGGSAKALNEIATKVIEINKLVADGKANWADVTMEIGKSVPVLSHVFGLGETINELFTGEKAALAEQNAEIERMNQLMEAQVGYSKALREAMDGYAARAQAAKTEIAAINAELGKRPNDAARIRAEGETEAKVTAAKNAFKSENDTLREKEDAVKKALRDKRDAAMKPFDERGWSVDFVRENLAKEGVNSSFKEHWRPLVQSYDAAAAEIRRKEEEVRKERATREAKHVKEIEDIRLQGVAEEAKRQANLPAEQLKEQWALTDKLQGFGEETQKVLELLDKNRDTPADTAESLLSQAWERDAKAATDQINQMAQNQADAAAKQRQQDEEAASRQAEKDAQDAANLQAKQYEAAEAQAEKVRDSIMTPAEQLQKAVDDLTALKDAGLLNEEEFNRAVSKAQGDAFSETKLPALIRSGSAEAFAARYANGPGNESLAVMKEQLQTAKDAPKEIGQAVADSIKEGEEMADNMDEVLL